VASGKIYSNQRYSVSQAGSMTASFPAGMTGDLIHHKKVQREHADDPVSKAKPRFCAAPWQRAGVQAASITKRQDSRLNGL